MEFDENNSGDIGEHNHIPSYYILTLRVYTLRNVYVYVVQVIVLLLCCVLTDIMELKRMMEKLGQAKTHLELKKMIAEVDTNNSGLSNKHTHTHGYFCLIRQRE